MKKFTKILGFLGFFVTLAITQVGSAWAASVTCDPGTYLPAGRMECVTCPPGSDQHYGEGEFCPGQTYIDIPEGGYDGDKDIFECRKQCSGINSSSYWTRTYSGATKPADCRGTETCTGRCVVPSPDPRCPENNCGYNRNIPKSGQIICNALAYCEVDVTNENNWCPITCPTACNNAPCICPGGNCDGYDATVTVPGTQYCGSNECVADSNDEASYCPKLESCERHCDREGCPNNLPSGATCEYRDTPSPNTGHYNEKHECVDNNGDPVLSPGLCQYVVDCGENYHWDGSTCVGNDAKVTYICNNGMGEQGAGPNVQYGVDFYVNKQPNNANGGPVITCTAPNNNQTFQGWSLTVGSTSYDGPYGNDYVFQPWNIPLPAGTSVVFTAKWSGTCYSVSFDDEQNGGHPSGWPDSTTPGTHGPFYKKYNDPDNKWYDTPACDRPIEDPEDVNVSNNLPVKDNATFTGYYTRIYPVLEIFNDNGVLTNDGQSWTINDNAVLYAHYECNANYHPDTNFNSQTYNQCIGNGVNVTYTCLPPVSNGVPPYSQTYQDAIYNDDYTVRAVGTGEYQVPCSFVGYEFTGNNLSTGYKWDLEGYIGSGDGQFAPGYIFQPWNYTTEQTFKLKCTECWRPKKYTVEYRCGTIDDNTYQNYSVSGNPTEDMAIYGENYTVAASHVYEQPFLNSCEEPEGYTVQSWSLYCDDDNPRTQPDHINDYDTLAVIDSWTYDYTTLGYDICYFIANWAHTDFKITLSQDGADPTSDPDPYLYTRYRLGVFLDSGRTVNMSPDNNPLHRTPQKPVTVIFNGDDGHNHVGGFEWNGNNNATYGETGIDLKLDGFYDEDGQNHPDPYINEEGYITEDGHLAGRSYQTDETWVAHWKPGAVVLPWPVNPPAGYTFVGWNCDGTLHEGAQTIVISDDTECFAVFKEACYEVTFNDTEHGGPDVTVANNPARYVKYGVTGENAWQTRWYMDSGCSVPWYVSGYLLTVDTPTKVHATFTGYYDEGENPDEQVFGSNGALTDDGQYWETQGDTILYAQYTCDHMYHLMPDGSCGSCEANEYWDQNTGECKSCGNATGDDFPYSTPPFNWSINQCYNYCGSAPGTDEQFCDEDPSVGNLYDPSGFRIVDNNLSDQHKQIEFYGNYSANPRITACDGTVQYCAYGFVYGDGDNQNARIKPMTAPVDFRNADGTDILGTRYIFGSRTGGNSIDVNPSSAKVWSQIVGPAQKTEVNPGNGNYGNYYYTYIIYPTYLAPDPNTPTGYEFTGYYYPQEDGTQYVEGDRILGLSNAQSVLNDPTNTGDSNTARNLYANYELHNYTLSYDCNCPDGVNCEPHPADQQVQYQQPYTPHANTCTYTGHVFEGWMPSGSEPTITPDLPNGGFTPRRWPYTTDKTFKAKWSGVLTPTIHYENMDNATRPDDWETTMPNTYTCGTATPISGEPTLNNGMFVGWCTDAALSDCNVTQTIPANTECTDKTFYAQWECEAPYHLNAAGDNCVTCLEGYFYDPSSPDLCTKCDDYLHATPGTWTTKPPYNWGAEQCYRVCGTDTNDDQDATTCQEFTGTVGNNVSIPSIEQFVTFNGGTGTQISFYGNEQDGIHTCRSRTGTNYCPFGLYSIIQVLDRHAEPMAAPVNFYDDDETFLDTHYIIGSRNAPAFTQISGPITWTRIAGAGQQYSVLNNPSNKYTYIVYPVTLAPEVSHPGYTIDGYVSPRDSSTEYVDDNLGLNTTNAQNILSGITNVIAGSRNLYAKYTQNEYTLTYNCGADDTGTPPNQETGIHLNDSIEVKKPFDCSHWGNTEFRGWLVSENGGTQQPGELQWPYESSKTFTAIWGDAQVFNITYELNGGTNYNGAPNSYTYGVGAIIGEGGLMPHRDYSEFLGWCDDAGLTQNCNVTRTIPPTATGDKTFYAKWECLSPYHEAPDGQSCTWCADNQYWDADTQTCKSCSTETNGRFPYSKHPFNFSKNQCYNYCEVLYNRQVSCVPVSIENTYDRCPFEKVDNSAKQIEFYGNDQANVTACDGTVQYCAYGFAGCNSPEALMKPMTAPVDFNKKTIFNGSYTSAGTRYIFGSRNGGNSIDLNPSTAKVWSQIVGPGQKTNVMNNANNNLGDYYYTHIIYPTYIAPDANISDHAFNGYYDRQTGGDMHVGSTYILDATNAQSVISDSDLTGNSNNPRTLYAQYCGEGQHSENGECVSDTWDVRYDCGTHGTRVSGMSMTNTATYNVNYTVAYQSYQSSQMIAKCEGNAGYVFNSKWKLNDTNTTVYNSNEDITPWRYTMSNPTFTAQYDCAAGYTLQNGECKPGVGLCQAQLPTDPDPHATMTVAFENDQCVYTITCELCPNGTPGCYNHNGGQTWGIIGQTTGVLPGSFCTPTEYVVTYDCGSGNDGGSVPDDEHPVSYEGSYTVLANGTINGGVVSCSSDAGQFNGWKFNGDGNTYTSGNSISPWIYNMENPTLTAVYSECPEGYVLVNNSQVLNRCMPRCSVECTETCPYEHADHCEYPILGHSTEGYQNGGSFDPDAPCLYEQNGTAIEPFDCVIIKVVCENNYYWNNESQECQLCPSGYHINATGDGCDPEGQYVINLNANIGDFYGLNSAPNKLYTIHNTGVYLDPTHSFEMTPRPNNTNPLSDEPTKYATVHFYPNGNGASFVWNGSSYTTDVQTNKQFTFNGFYETASSNIQYIESDGYLTTAGQNAGKGLNGDTTWYAQWTAPTIGTLPSSPQRPGYTFVGWYDASVYGNPVTANATVNQRDMHVYAHWNAKTITITLDANGGIAGSNFLSTLYQQYDWGWSRNQSGQFNSDFYLDPNELPVAQNESLRFKGYYTQRSDGSQMIANGGHVVTAPTHATDEIWYAQYETSTGPFTVAFRCNSNSQPFYTNSNVYVNNNITVPANTNCSQNGMTFSQWKPTLHPSINMISAGASQTMYQWTYNFSEVFEPDWNAKVYEITLLPGDGAFGNFGGVTKLYEKYGTGWSLSQTGPFNPSITLSGNALPSLAGYNFAGYIAQNGAWRGTVDNNVWTSPQPDIIGPETWYAKYTRCVTGQYYDDGQCKDCTSGYQLNPAAMSQDECYGQCDWYCTQSGCPTVGQNGVASCSYIGTEVSHSGIMYLGAPQQCYTESQSLPLPMPATHPDCEHRITCIEPDYVYNSATDSCDKRKTSDITLLSHIFTGQGTVASPELLYTVNGVGVFLDSAHQQQMTVNGHALSNTPTNYVNLTLNGNGVAFSWNGQTGNSPTGKAWLTFRGFYENQNSGTNNPMIGSNGYITQNGSNTGASYTQHRDWHAIWDNGSIEVPKPTRSGYVFDGWWTACNGGDLKSMGDESVIITPSTASITWCAHWKAESYDVIYSCGTDPEWGGSAIDSDHPTYNGTYTVKDNNVVVQCSKPEYGFAGRWSFSEATGFYNANQSISWVFQGGTPTFTAQYERCEPTQYVDLGACKDCPNGYPYHDYGATESTQCYAKDSIECIKQSDECDAPGVLYCTFVISGVPCKYYYPNGVDDCHTDGQVPNCEINQIICKPEYTLVGRKCLPRDQYTITLNQNGGTGGQDELYTIYQTNVYRDVARTEAMSPSENPLFNYPTKYATVTFKYCDGDNGSCESPVTSDRTVNVDSAFKGYYNTTFNGAAQYINSNYFITDTGLNAGKSYQSNSYTWYAQWDGGTVSPWPNPTRSGYTFEGWWDQITGGTEVTANTTVSENVTWYAHWCEECPSDIQHGTCTVVNQYTECAHKVVCEAGYQQNGLYCIPIGNLKLTYQPNSGTAVANLGNNGPNVNGDYVFSYNYGTEFRTLDYDVYTRDQHVLTGWERREPNNCLSPILDFDTLTTYNCQSDAVVRAKWLKCECTGMGPGFDHCTMSVENNKCKPSVYCKPGYVPNRIMACDELYITPCEVSCIQCPAGTYQHDDQCTQCEGDTISAAGVTECTPCSNGYHANPAHTECTPNTITIDWEENNGSYPDLDNGQCTYGGNLILEQAPQNAPEEAFLGWWLSNHGLGRKNAGASVQCEFDTTGVYEGISRDIQADWMHCECTLNSHVSNCIAHGTDNGTCECVLVGCDSGYTPVQSTAYTCSPECVAGTSHVIYDCGTGSGTPPTPDNATYNEPYTVQNNTGCHKDNAPFVGWSFNGSLYAGGDVINPWTYTGDATFVAQYGTQCQLNEILINNTCVPCDCSYDDNSGVSTCNRYPIASNNCGGTPTCLSGYIRPSVNCTGPGSTNCTATCTPCGSTQISVGNTCEDCTCTGTGATCGQLSVTNNMCNWTPQCLDRYIGLNHNCYGGSNCNASCTECPAGWISNADHTNCIECDGGTYQNGNECVPCNTPGYTSLPGSTSVADCNIPLQYTIEYQANGGVNARTHIAGQPEYQSDLTYNVGFVTYDGTIFTKTDSVIINWDRISGGDYTILNHWYEYNVTENTTLRAHWAQCECSTGAGASSCGTLSTDGNTCNWTNPVCQDGYVSPNMQCTGTGNTNCTLTCGQCDADEIIVDGVCVPCTCTAGTGAASCTPGSTSNNACTATGQCSAGYGKNDNGNANIECSGTNCVVSYNKCNDGWVSNANCECVICPENTYQDGNVCKNCPLGTTSPAGSTSASACTVSGFTLVYRSNNGQNRTVRENYDYMQSFITKPGTTFAWAGHIMTQWDTAENTGTKTFADGYAELNRNYVYSDVANIILDAHWEQCTCTEGEGVVADSCSPLSTNDNTCGCNATCNDGLRFAGCNCNGTVCSPVCEPVTSNAVYTCGSGTGTGYSESVAFGATYHIKNNAWCVKDKSTFAGWKFNGNNVIYLGGDTITWNYKTDREFTALWCPSCSDPADHCELLIPNPGECQVTCNEGYRWDNDQKKCIAKTDLRLTYQPNGGKPNQNIPDYFTYGQSFTTKPGTTYTKARHIMTHWNVESGGEHTFTAGIAQLNSPYTYKTDGDTVLSAQWQECADGTIVIGNECVACSCTEGAGVVHNSCSVQSTDNNLCTGTVECQDGYVGANVSCDGAQCTATCNACQSNEVSVNGECVECECTYTDDSGVASCDTSVVRNTCTQDPTCKPGYANPTLDCGGAGNAKCDAKCEICPAGTYGPDGRSCKPCPNGKTSYPGSTSINQCFVDPGSCDDDEHVEQGVCVPNVMECAAPDAYLATRTWNASIGTYGPCIIESCIEGYHILANTCVLNTCSISHGHGEYDSGSDTCYVTKCDPGYYESGNACVECENKIVDGDVAVSSYVSECEIAACMYQGQKYALDTKNNECVPICTADRFTLEDPDNPTGTIQWDERTKKCIRTCNPGYKMW